MLTFSIKWVIRCFHCCNWTNDLLFFLESAVWTLPSTTLYCRRFIIIIYLNNLIFFIRPIFILAQINTTWSNKNYINREGGGIPSKIVTVSTAMITLLKICIQLHSEFATYIVNWNIDFLFWTKSYCIFYVRIIIVFDFNV